MLACIAVFTVNFTSNKKTCTFAKENFSLHNTDFSTRAQYPKLGCPSSLLEDELSGKNSVLSARPETLIALPTRTLSVQPAITTYVRTKDTVTLITAVTVFILELANKILWSLFLYWGQPNESGRS